MSYIPKYILKRMFASDAVKTVPGGIEITMTNVISPLSVDEVPDDVENYIEFTVDGKPLEAAKKKDIRFSFGEKSFSIENAKEFAGVVIPVGEKITFFAPVSGLEPGTEHEIGITIKTDNPFQLAVSRVVQ